MRKVITYGTYDLLHEGHIRLLERAKALGDYLIVGVTSDRFDRERGKLNVSQTTLERVDAVRATGIADEVIVEEYEGQKIDDIQRLGVDVFTVGSDWEGHFDYLREWCEVIYLPRTQGVSSSEARARRRRLRLAVVGNAPFAHKVLSESKYVDGLEVIDARGRSQSGLPSEADAVMFLSHPSAHYEQVRAALAAGMHVLCEAPASFSRSQEEELFRLARVRGVVLVDAVKAAYSTAYEQLLHLVKGGAIGKVVSVDATCTALRADETATPDSRAASWNSMCEWAPTALLPVFQLLGTNYEDLRMWSLVSEDEGAFDLFSKIDFAYDGAVASAKVGKGAKSESELVVTGTAGYAYVPAPWWKTGYFELRYEDPADNKRYFFPLEGEGIRYELASFVQTVERRGECPHVSSAVAAEVAEVVGSFHRGEGVRSPWAG